MTITATRPGVPPAVIVSISNRLGQVDLNHGPIAKYFEQLAHQGTDKAKAILVEADTIADELGLDGELLDSLLAGL